MLVSRRSLPDGQRHAAPLKSPATMSTCSCSITVRTVNIHFFLIPRFLAKWLLMCDDIVVKSDLPLRGNLRDDTREMTACRTHPDCPSPRPAAAHLWYRGGNLDVRVKSVLVEQDSTATIMSHMEVTRQVFVLEVLDCLLQSNDVPFPRDLFLDGTFFPRRGPAFQL